MKLIIVAVVLSSSVALAFSNPGIEKPIGTGAIGSKTFGEHKAGDKLIHHETIQKMSMGPIIRHQFRFRNERYHVNRVELINISGNELGQAYYEIYGGFGENYVSIDFRSIPVHGIWYEIKIYGVPVSRQRPKGHRT